MFRCLTSPLVEDISHLVINPKPLASFGATSTPPTRSVPSIDNLAIHTPLERRSNILNATPAATPTSKLKLPMVTPLQNRVPHGQASRPSAPLRSTRSVQAIPGHVPSTPQPETKGNYPPLHHPILSPRPAPPPLPTLRAERPTREYKLGVRFNYRFSYDPQHPGLIKATPTSRAPTRSQHRMTDSTIYQEQPSRSRRESSLRRPPTPFPTAARLPPEMSHRSTSPLPGSSLHRSHRKAALYSDMDDLEGEREGHQRRRDVGLKPTSKTKTTLRRRQSKNSLASRVSFSEIDDDLSLHPPHKPQHRSHHDLPSLLKSPETPQPIQRGAKRMFGGGHTVSPFSNLRGYLAHSSIEKFERWPESGQRQSFGRSDWGPSGREFTRRLNLAEAQRNRRQLRGWARDDYFKDMVVDDVEVHVPDTLLAKDDRRGEERFTVPATNFHTKRFRETSSVLPCDQYLLQWLNGTVLTSALSAVHAIRFHYTDATFMYAPSAVRRKGHKEKNYQGFPDGYGSLILVRDEANGGPALGPIDRRALLVSVVPPSPYTKEVLSAFTRTQEHWKQYSRSDNTSGLANLLQAQMYDECVAHGVRYWVATTLKWWVFGVFNKDLTQCVVSSKIRRSETACTVLECLVTWMRRALEAEEEAYCLAEQKEEWRDGNAFAPYNNRPALQRIPRKTTESRETSSTRTAPTESRQGKPTRKQTVPRTVPQLAEQRVRQRSTSFTRSQGRSKTELNQDGHTPTNPDSELESSQQKQDRRRERERVREGNARAQHTHVERYTYVRPVPVQFVHGFAPHAPAYFYQQRWF